MHTEIVIDEISSISESLFSFKRQGKVIDHYPLQRLCKKKPISHGKEDMFHLGEGDLNKLNDLCADIFPFAACISSPYYRGLKKNDYISLMKYTLYWYIQSGEMTYLLARLLKVENPNFKITWDSTSNAVPNRPVFCKVPL